MRFRYFALSFLAILILAVIGCASEKILAESPAYRAVKGKHFVLLQECYVYREVHDKTRYPFVGFVSTVPGIGTPEFPQNARTLIGKRVKGIEILDVLPKGTVFEVIQLRQLSNFECVLIGFDISPIGPLGKKWPVLDGLWLTNELTNYPSIQKLLGW